MNFEAKLIMSKRIPFWLIPIRYCYRLLAKRLSSKVMLKQITFNGYEVFIWAQEDIGKKLLLTGSFERDEIRYLERSIRADDVCFDVGGNTGIYAMLFAKLAGERGQIYVFEPVRRNSLAISLAAEINNFNNIHVFEGVASSENGMVKITLPEMDGAYAHIVKSNNVLDCIDVKSITLDYFVEEEGINRLDILKIDVEGAEFDVLRGAAGILGNEKTAPRVVMVELFSQFLGKFDSSIPEILEYMHNFGYLPYSARSDGSLIPYTSGDFDKIFNVFFLKG